MLQTWNYFFFFSSLAAFFSLAVFKGFFLTSFLTSFDLDISFPPVSQILLLLYSDIFLMEAQAIGKICLQGKSCPALLCSEGQNEPPLLPAFFVARLLHRKHNQVSVDHPERPHDDKAFGMTMDSGGVRTQQHED